MELLKDGQIVLNIDGFIISQNLHNKATATSLFGITNKNNLNIGHDDRTWVLEKDIICDTCNRCVGCQTCNSCNGCVSTVGCNDKCQGCTGSCTGCASNCYESCFGDCYTCQDCQTGCTSCNACTAGCDGGCQTECYACVSCDGCVGCDGDCVGCFNVCQESCQTCTSCASCTSCVSCQTGCQTGCFIFISPKPGTNCIVGCQAICQTCTGCDSNCYTGCTRCNGCTSGCTGGCQTGCQTGCTTACQMCTGDTCDNCNTCNNCTNYNGSCEYVPCSPCVGVVSCGSGQTPSGCTAGCTTGCHTGCTTGCDGGCQSCDSGCQNNDGETPEDVIQPDCWVTNSGGFGKDPPTNSGSTKGNYNGEKNGKAPNSWLKSGKTQEQWDTLSHEGVEDYAKANNIPIKPTDPKGKDDGTPFVGVEISSVNEALGINGKEDGSKQIDYKIDYKYNPETGLNEGYAVAEDGTILAKITQKPGSDDFTIENLNTSEGVASSTSTVKVNQDTGKSNDLKINTTYNDGSKTNTTEKGTQYTGSDGKTVDTGLTKGGC